MATTIHATCCGTDSNMKTARFFSSGTESQKVGVRQRFLPLKGFKSCHATPILQRLCLQNKNLVHTIRTTRPWKKENRVPIKGSSSALALPRNLPQISTASSTPSLAPICSGRFDCKQKDLRGVSPITLDPS